MIGRMLNVIGLMALVVIEPLQEYTFEAPAKQEFAVVRAGGTTVLPNGRYLTPKGKRIYGGETVFHVAVRPGGREAAMFFSGGMGFVRDLSKSGRVLPVAKKELAPAGVFTPDGKALVISLGDLGQLQLLDSESGEVLRTMTMPVQAGDRGYANSMAVSPDGKWLYVADVANQRIVTFSMIDGAVESVVDGGRQPYALCLSSDGKSLYVANIGLFNYSVIPGTEDPAWLKGGLTLPPFAFPSKESVSGIEVEGRFVPGIGEARVPDAQSVFQYDLSKGGRPELKKKVKSGLLIHAPSDGGKAVGGSAPNFVLFDRGTLWVSNANSDTVQAFDGGTMALKKTVKLTPHPYLARYRGVIPSGMVMSADGKTLYVCESGLNSVAVVDTGSGDVRYRIPCGWFPVSVGLANGGKSLVVATQKGIGRGPRGAMDGRAADDERFGLSDMPGMVQIVDLPSSVRVQKEWTNEVLRNNGIVPKRVREVKANPIPLVPGQASKQIKHVVFITKENHTFDGIFGGLKGSKSRPEYAEWGKNGWIRENGKSERVPIMPNHWKLAEQFSISDNFYMEPQASGDGHRWLIGVYPSLWTTRVFYAGWDFRRNDSAKGRLPSMGSNGSSVPEDYLENGSMWEHMDRGGISFRNYGEGFEFPGQLEPEDAPRSGSILQVNHPLNKVLFDNTCWDYPVYNTNIPDIARVEWFIEDLENNFRKPGKAIPQFMNITLCNDHGDRARPDDGYPYLSSFMADNDLALGQLIEYLSSLPEWESMAVFVTQDDSGGDDDHIDRHRSFVMALGPWAKKGYVSHDHTSIMSILKTIYLIFGMGPNNMFDALATDLRDMFTMTPDFGRYTHTPSDPRVFVPGAAYRKDDPKYKERRFMKPSLPMDDPRWFDELRKSSGGGK